jgi:aminoglycoside/choline kinase family phosphotransferase
MRDNQIADFLQDNGHATAALTALAGDASSRRYLRLQEGHQSFILMDAPPPEDVDQFVRVAKILHAYGYSAPEILCQDSEAGLLLLEDLGDTLFASLMEEGADEEKLYKLAVDFLLDLRCQPSASGLPEFSDGYVLSQNEVFLDWYIPDATDNTVQKRDRDRYEDIWRRLLPDIWVGKEGLLLRDFHAENLLLLEQREGLNALGLLDFQDALIGPAAYDLVSLLQDARRDVSHHIVEKMIDYYIQESGVEAASFRQSYAILGAHRALRIMGIFIRLAKTQGKTRYLDLLPRMKGHLDGNLNHPALSELKQWLDTMIGRIK